MISQWFGKDFLDVAGAVLVYIVRYVEDPELAKELMQAGYRIDYLDCDWSLNGVALWRNLSAERNGAELDYPGRRVHAPILL